MFRPDPIVRIAPNEYSIDDPEAAKVIFRSRNQLKKVHSIQLELFQEDVADGCRDLGTCFYRSRRA